MTFKPMLASPANYDIMRFPVLASVKLDGIRATVHDGQLMSRSMKPLPNKFLQAWCKTHAEVLNGLDGELIVGAPNEEETFRRTTSHVMADDKRDFAFTFYVFDRHDIDDAYQVRLNSVFAQVYHVEVPRGPSIMPLPKLSALRLLPHTIVRDREQLDAMEMRALDDGYEGLMTRDPAGRYKQGRASARSQELLKVKRNEDMEAEIIGFEERQHNGNEAFTNELGRTARSSHQANKIGMNTMGALVVRGINGPFKGVEFSVGTGMDDATRAVMWASRDAISGKIAKVKFFPLGSKDKPRHPVFQGIRHPDDMSEAA